MAFIPDIFQLIDTSITDILAKNAGNLMTVLSPVLLAGFTVYVIFVFWSYFGTGVESMFDILKRIIGWGVIISFSINIGSYTSNVVPVVSGLGDGLSQAFTGNTGGAGNTLNDLAILIIQSINDTYDQANGIEETTLAIFSCVVTAIFAAIFIMYAAAYILLAKLFCALLVIVGPVFIALALFPATRQFFSAWVNQVVNYSLMLLFYSILATLFADYVKKQFGDGGVFNSAIDFASLVYLPTMLGLFAIILIKIPDLASGLAGGIAVNGFGAAAQAATSAGRLAGAIKGKGGSRSSGGGSIKAEGVGNAK